MNHHMHEPLDAEQSRNYVAGEFQSYMDLKIFDSLEKMRIGKRVLELINALSGGHSRTGLSTSVDTLVHAIDQSERAAEQAIQAAHAEAESLSERVAQLENTRATPPIPLATIEKELARRAAERARVVGIQEQLENERDELLEEVERQKGGRSDTKVLESKIQSLTVTIDSIVANVAENDREVIRLKTYQQAVRTVAEGIGAELIGKKLAETTARVRSIS